MEFTINWDNADLLGNTNNTGQKAFYRRKSTGGAFIGSNILPKTLNTVSSPILLPNVIYEFKVEAICTEGGSLINGNGVVEALGFICLEPEIEFTHNTSDVAVDITETDISKIVFTLKKSSNNTVVGTPITSLKGVGSQITATIAGLTPSTSYYWETVMYATVGGQEKVSTVCGPYNFVTDDYIAPICSAPLSLVVSNS
jgi:hypothetical protein